MNNAENSNASENSWLDRTLPKEAQLSILLVFKVALLIFYHKHVEVSGYLGMFPNFLDATSNGLLVLPYLALPFIIATMVHLLGRIAVNALLIFAIGVNIFAICRIVKSKTKLG